MTFSPLLHAAVVEPAGKRRRQNETDSITAMARKSTPALFAGLIWVQENEDVTAFAAS